MTEWARFQTIGFSEVEPYCCKLLAGKWPGIKNYGDLRTADFSNLMLDHEHYEIMKDGKYAGIVGMYDSGLSIEDIADYYGVTRQSMWKSLMRRGCKFREQLKFVEDNHFHTGQKNVDKRGWPHR